MKKTAEKPLTDKQRRILEAMPDGRWVFPNKDCRESTFEILHDRGFVRRELKLFVAHYGAKSATFKSCYQRTVAGKKAVGSQ